MGKNFLLLFVSTAATLVIATVGIRYLAPGLLGISPDLKLVQIDTKVPPFFSNIFRDEDYKSDRFILNDPVTKHRAKPKFPELGYAGPHDLLGFRNRLIPGNADVVFIGDSFTYGNNAPVELNFPNQVRLLLSDRISQIYNMSVGGWGGVQYFNIFPFALTFSPELIVIAYYSGNDPVDSLKMAYSNKIWKQFVIRSDIDHNHLPPGKFPPPESTWWKVRFNDGIETIFTPRIRLKSNADHPTVDAAWEVLQKTAVDISKVAEENNIPLLFTIIPTKELVYAKKVGQEGLSAPKEYHELVTMERRRIDQFAETASSLGYGQYVDVVQPLQSEALKTQQLYPADINGHPVSRGYQVIAKEMAKAIQPMLNELPSGLNIVTYPKDNQRLALIQDNRYWLISDMEWATRMGLRSDQPIPHRPPSVLSNLVFSGVIDEVPPEY